MTNIDRCSCHKTKSRSEKEKKELLNRLNRIEEQIRWIKGMIEKDVYWTYILLQTFAVNAAMNYY